MHTHVMDRDMPLRSAVAVTCRSVLGVCSVWGALSTVLYVCAWSPEVGYSLSPEMNLSHGINDWYKCAGFFLVEVQCSWFRTLSSLQNQWALPLLFSSWHVFIIVRILMKYGHPSDWMTVNDMAYTCVSCALKLTIYSCLPLWTRFSASCQWRYWG